MCVRYHVDQDLLQLVAIGPQNRQVVGEAEHHLYVVVAELVGQQLHRVLHETIQCDQASFRWLLAG